MTAQLTHHLAQQLIDDLSRAAQARRNASVESTNYHVHQRELVQASLLLSRREDRPVHRRWA